MDITVLTLAGLVAGSFVATSMDNLLILVLLLGANAKHRFAVLLGYGVSAIAVMAVSILGVALGSLFGADLIGYLGIVPVLLGLRMLYRNWMGAGAQGHEVEIPGGESAIWWSTFILMFSNSGDSVAVFLPLLAESGWGAILVIVVCYFAAALLWAGLSCLISGHPGLARSIEKVGEKIVPWVMIAMGIYILSDTATDTLI